jgi:hypothetical protein
MSRYLTGLLFAVLLALPLHAALPSGTVWEVRQASSDNNGGGFVTGSSGTDFSQQASAQIAYTDLVIGATTTQFTSVLNPVGNTLPGNIVQIISGSGCTAGFYEVVSNATTTATADRSLGTAASVCVANLGGALGTLGKLNTAMSTTNNITQTGWVKANATYSISSAITFNMSDNTKGTSIQINGYTTTRGDNGQATLQATAGSFRLVTISNNNSLSNMTFRNFILDCNAQSSSNGFQFFANGNNAENLKVSNCTGASGIDFDTFTSVMCRNCWVHHQTGGSAFLGGSSGAVQELCLWCTAEGGTVLGFNISAGFICVSCVSANNTGVNTDCADITTNGIYQTIFLSSIFYGCGRDGMLWTGDASAQNQTVAVLNSVFVSNGRYGFNNTGSTGTAAAYGTVENYNAYYNNTTADVNLIAKGAADVALSGDPFVSGSTLNFALNNTAGAGNALQGVGFPGVLASVGTGSLDIGALQHVPVAGAKAVGFVGP